MQLPQKCHEITNQVAANHSTTSQIRNLRWTEHLLKRDVLDHVLA